MRAAIVVTLGLLILPVMALAQPQKPEPAGQPAANAIARGVGYLTKEVTKRQPGQPCAVCGDPARALLAASAKGHDIGPSLDAILQVLKQPSDWDRHLPAGVDKPLARIQFAAALALAERLGKAASTDLEAAAKLLAADQQPDGSWPTDQAHAVGSPATYGPVLATWSARSSLISSGMQPDHFTIVQADRWIRGLTVDNVFDAAATVLALELSSDVMADNLRRAALGIIRKAQSPTGGWGPDAAAAPQVFDTALAVLALASLEVEPRLARSTYRPEELKEAIANGKTYLVSQQRPDGSWPETSRLKNQDSRVHGTATTGWALLALLAGQ